MVRRKQQNRDARQSEFLFEDFETKKFHYNAGENTNSRDNVTADPSSEDRKWEEAYGVHSARARKQLRNFAMLSWMIDKHLDFVATSDVEFKTRMDWLDDWLEELLKWWSEAEHFEVGKRYSMYQYLRVNEAQRVLHGDMGTLKMADGRVMRQDIYMSSSQGLGLIITNSNSGMRLRMSSAITVLQKVSAMDVSGRVSLRGLTRCPFLGFSAA